ncbi:unnamed protein product [Arabis nemorensis]|uniref:DUF4283 domain-containing protein n=1 Tax=Arabis nemorensis TaxID=586526 RepID=A0A565BC81_9BRAS|nr:unnamed protein product [Arabis nemorensis]
MVTYTHYAENIIHDFYFGTGSFFLNFVVVTKPYLGGVTFESLAPSYGTRPSWRGDKSPLTSVSFYLKQIFLSPSRSFRRSKGRSRVLIHRLQSIHFSSLICIKSSPNHSDLLLFTRTLWHLTKSFGEICKVFDLDRKGEKWFVHEEAQEEFDKEHRLCLVAKAVNPAHQNPAGIKAYLPGHWGLAGQVDCQIQDDGSVNFYFKKKHHMMTVLEKAPYTYRGWMVVLDRWSNRGHPTFFQHTLFG